MQRTLKDIVVKATYSIIIDAQTGPIPSFVKHVYLWFQISLMQTLTLSNTEALKGTKRQESDQIGQNIKN